eukprot:TRINITY_DN49240_c0_g1_i1.p1 TRINITY_DN49240_c0_g1~~TRINITY_DN49240_c0_g1_i1.p1  ORF type:complete len:852 (+),score=98.40 TRINITY_DN49240_c0_g1_i1:652-3207(+)
MTCWPVGSLVVFHATAVTTLLAMKFRGVDAFAKIFKHEIVDGKWREVSCSSLAECIDHGFSTPGMMLHRAWAIELEGAMKKREASLASLNGSAWYNRQAQIRSVLRRKMFRSSQPRGDAPPMRQVRSYTDDERGVRVSMILFESWPGHSVPAVLYEPLGARDATVPLPAILHLTGHFTTSLRDVEEQQMSLGLAQEGFVVLSFDPLSQGERQQYRTSSGLECFARRLDEQNCSEEGPPCSHAHNHFGKQFWLLGHNVAEIFVHDAQRALDLLSALPWVDTGRIGAVGCSGGGMMAAYIGAADDRISATCIACYFSSLMREVEVGHCNYDAEQILWEQAALGLDKPDFIVARAPLPTLVLLTTHDCFPLSGGREGIMEASRAYAEYGALNKLYLSEAVGYHEVTSIGLTVMKEFFIDQLGPVLAVPTPRRKSPLPCGRLIFGKKQLATGVSDAPISRIVQVLRGIARPKLARLRVRRRSEMRSVACGRWLRSLPDISAGLAGIDDELLAEVERKLGGGEYPTLHAISDMNDAREGGEEWYLLPSKAPCSVTLRVFGRGMSDRSAPAVLIFGGPALFNVKLPSTERRLLELLLSRGLIVVVAGLCGFEDEELWRDGLREFAPLLVGRTHVGFHAAEVLRVVAFASAVLHASRVVLMATGGATAAVTHAALHVPPRVQRTAVHAQSRVERSFLAGIVLVRGICCYADVATAELHRLPWQMQMHGVLDHYDLPDLLASVAHSRPGLQVLVLHPLGASGRALPSRRARQVYELAAHRLAVGGGRLRIRDGGVGVGNEPASCYAAGAAPAKPRRRPREAAEAAAASAAEDAVADAEALVIADSITLAVGKNQARNGR